MITSLPCSLGYAANFVIKGELYKYTTMYE